MDIENQVAPEPNVRTVQPEVKKCNHVPIIVILSVLAVCGFAFGGFELNENIQIRNQLGDAGIDVNDKNSNDSDVEKTNEGVVTGSAQFNVPNPTFDSGDNDGTVKFEYGVKDNVLSTYSIYYYEYPTDGAVVSEVLSNNVDINTKEELNNIQMLGRMGFTIEEAYHKILENLATNVSIIDSFLLNTNGDISGETISISDFKNNIDEYAGQLKDNQNLLYVLLKDSGVSVSYKQHDILEALGMSSHMDVGLVREYVEVEL